MNATRDVVDHLPVNVRPGSPNERMMRTPGLTSVWFADALFLKHSQADRYSPVMRGIVEIDRRFEDRWRAATVQGGVSTRHV